MNEEEFLKAVCDLVEETIEAQLAAKDEQLAEMRGALESFLHWLRPFKGGEWVIPDTVKIMCEQLEDFISSPAAPKRGRVVWRGKRRATVWDNGWATLKALRIEASVGVKHNEEFTVTVREAE